MFVFSDQLVDKQGSEMSIAKLSFVLSSQEEALCYN
jgi:hypothetical protein